MKHMFLWIYILSIFTGFTSLYSSYILLIKSKKEWLKFYLLLHICLFLISFFYSIFYFIFAYTDNYSLFLDKMQALIFSLLTTILMILVIKIVTLFSKHNIRKKALLIFLSIPILLFITFIIEIILNSTLFFYSKISIFAVTVILIVSIISVDLKKIWKDRNSRILVFLLGLSLLFLPIEFIEDVIRKSFLDITIYLPQGMLSYPVYFLFCSILNIVYNIPLITKDGSQKNEVIGNISQSFINKYSITKREKEICELLLKAKSQKEIGFQLGISFRTVGNHVYNIYRKTGVNSLMELLSIINK